MLNTAVQLLLLETFVCFVPLSCSPPQGATKNGTLSKLRSHMISLALLNLVEFRLLLVESCYWTRNQEAATSEELIQELLSSCPTDPFILLHLYVTKWKVFSVSAKLEFCILISHHQSCF